MDALRRGASLIVKRFTERKPIVGRDLQLRTETNLLYSIANGSYCQNAELSESLARAAEQVTSENEDIPFEDQANVVRTYLMSKVVDMLSPMSEARSCDKNVDEAIRSGLKPLPRVLESTAANAGLGLHIDGKAKCGDVIGLYPGICYLPSDIRHLPNFPNVTKDNDYLIWRYDGIIIDGKAALTGGDYSTEECSVASERCAELAQHPFAQGHRVNHPPKGKLPNCLRFMVNIRLDSAEVRPLRHLIPNKLFGPSTRSRLDWLTNLAATRRIPTVSAFGTIGRKANMIPTLAVIATRDICDEEVFMNYRFNPCASNIPEWYYDCDPESTKRRWTEMKAF